MLPVHQFATTGDLAGRGLADYWGYGTIGFFAPHDGYSAAVRAGRAGGQVAEFQAMVRALHAAGLEVLLDVVFNPGASGRGSFAVMSSHCTCCHRLGEDPHPLRVVLAGPRVLGVRPKVSAIMSIHGMSATSFHQPPRKVTERAAGASTEHG